MVNNESYLGQLRESLPKHIFTTNDLIRVADAYYSYLTKVGFLFSDDGYPIFSEDQFLNEWPDVIIPYTHRHDKVVENKRKTVICYFMKDKYIYPRFCRIVDDLEKYKDFMGVVQIDTTVTSNMDEEFQNFIMLMNQLHMAILAINEIKIILNTRCGSVESMNNLKHFPKNIMSASGFLGCEKSKNYADTNGYIEKIFTISPSKLVVYGKEDEILMDQLNILGCNFKRYDDFHRMGAK